ncbi:hypothetical protein NPIL_340951 [Nephila pilipes]|uniref:Uncharacterized protein n=1 Tax=Nephila pilipes TaxID=299642 RepID=A0A8X6QSK8_NEPPI|nr:hypothetical protein NPIL_239731 [Nephila pilipes]GFT50277.1 hypothetical protein NPIL_76311 [Nephila pilipes]GFT84097.1 hypothetical protein NPIL_520871 [Nephila pilipes]GFU41345.1 hypothetical protein NPIL_340951 [Nephila pilipes]
MNHGCSITTPKKIEPKFTVATLEFSAYQESKNVEIKCKDSVQCIFLTSVGWFTINLYVLNEPSNPISTKKTSLACTDRQTETTADCRSLEAPPRQRSRLHPLLYDAFSAPDRGCYFFAATI